MTRSPGRRLVASVGADVEPQVEAAGRPPIAVTVADDLVGEIELGAIELPVLLHMRLVAIGGDRDLLRRHRHLRGRDIAQLDEAGEETTVPFWPAVSTTATFTVYEPGFAAMP